MAHEKTISIEALTENLNNPDWIIFDCRFSLKDAAEGLKSYKQGHIPGALFADMDKDLSSSVTATSGRHPLPDPDELIDKLQNWGVNNSSQIICYDDVSGAYAARMWWLLKWLGHDDVAVLDGGIKKWTEKNLNIETEIQARPKGCFKGAANDDMWVDINFIQQQLEQNNINLLDARTRDRFTAKDTKTDPVPGHIPGAVSFPFVENINKHGLFLSVAELKQRYEKLFGEQENKEVINMCGSGVTACHNLLAMQIAGLPMTRLYVGSWSEWIKEKGRPVATGSS